MFTICSCFVFFIFKAFFKKYLHIRLIGVIIIAAKCTLINSQIQLFFKGQLKNALGFYRFKKWHGRSIYQVI